MTTDIYKLRKSLVRKTPKGMAEDLLAPYKSEAGYDVSRALHEGVPEDILKALFGEKTLGNIKGRESLLKLVEPYRTGEEGYDVGAAYRAGISRATLGILFGSDIVNQLVEEQRKALERQAAPQLRQPMPEPDIDMTTAQGWKITEKGNFISPAGMEYTAEQLNAMRGRPDERPVEVQMQERLNRRMWEETVLPSLPNELRAVYGLISDEEFNELFKTWQEDQKNRFMLALEKLLPESFEPFDEEQKINIAMNMARSLEQDEGFQQLLIEKLRQAGRNEETESIIRTLLPGATERDIRIMFGQNVVPLETLSPSSYKISEQPFQDVMDFAFKDPEGLRLAMRFEGRTPETEALLKRIYGEANITDEYLKKYFEETIADKFVQGQWLPGPLKDYWDMAMLGIGDIFKMSGGAIEGLSKADIKQRTRYATSAFVLGPFAQLGIINFDRLGLDSLAKELQQIGLYGQYYSRDVKLAEKYTPQWFAQNMARMAPMTLGLMGISLATGGTASAAIASAGGGAFLQAAGGAAVGGILGSIGEGMLEAGDAYNRAKEKGFSDEEANAVFDKVFMQNVAGLSVSNALQYGLTFFIPGGRTSTFMAKALIYGFDVATEGLEEVGQLAIQRAALGEEWRKFDDEMLQNFALGASAGLVFAGFGSLHRLIQDKIIEKMNPGEYDQLRQRIQEFMGQGMNRKEAESRAWDEFAGTPQGDEAIKAAVEEVVAAEKAKIAEQKPAIDKAVKEMTRETTVASPRVDTLVSEIRNIPEEAVPAERPPAAEVTEAAAPEVTTAEIDTRIEEIKNKLATPGRLSKGEKPKTELRTELAELEARKVIEQAKARNEPDVISEEIAKVEEELGNRALPYSGNIGFRRTAYFRGYTGEQLETYLNRLKEEEAKITGEQSAVENYDELQKMYDIWRGKLDTLNNMRQRLYDAAKKAPLSVRGKMLAAMKNVKTEAQLEEAINRVRQYAAQEAARKLRADIRSLLKRARTRKVRGIIKGKYSAEVQERLDAVAGNINGDRDAAQEKIVENIRAYESGSLSPVKMREANEMLAMTGIDNMTVDELRYTYEYIKALVDYGRVLNQGKRTQEKARLDKIRADASGIITGGKGLKPGGGTISARELMANKSWLDKLVNAQYAWPDLLDKLSKFARAKPFQSMLSKFGQDAVSKARRAESIGIEKAFADIMENFRRIFGIKSKGQMNQLLNRMGRDKVTLGTFKNTEGVEVTLNLTKDQIISKYHQLKDPTLESTFREGMKWTDGMMDAIRNNLTAQEKAWSDWIMEFYDSYYDSVNKIYREIYGVNMPHNPNYSPLRRDFKTDEAENLLNYRDIAIYASVTNGSLKARVKNIRPLKFNGAIELLINHVTQMEHFKGWAGPMHDLRAVLGSDEVKNAVHQYHGTDIYNRISEYLNDFARGGIEKQKINRAADWLRRNFTLSVLGIKPAIALKQVPSVVAYMTEMPVGDFVSGVAHFWENPVANYRYMMERSVFLRERFGAGFERDIKYALEKRGIDKLTNKTELRTWFMTLIRLGDKLAVSQGMWAKYRSELKAGKTEEEAMMSAEQSTERTQPTFSLDSLSAWQRGGSFMKLLTMFQNQPNKYFRILGNNIRNFQYGRGGRAKAASNIFIAWVVAPALFQFIADAFQFRPERQARAWVLGPLNWLLIFGQFAQSAYNWIATDDKFDYQISPVVQTPQDILNIANKAMKMISKGGDPYENITVEDWVNFVEYFGKTAGEVFGYPTPWLVQVEKGIREGDPRQIIFSKWSLEEPKDRRKEDAENISMLGQQKPIEETAELGLEIPDIYDMADLNSYFRKRYHHVLPDDIIADKKSTPEGIAWALKEKAAADYYSLPNGPLYKINSDPDKDDTIIQYWRQWQARQQIDNLADLTEFDRLYPKAYLGNVSRRQYELLTQYLEADDKDKFLEDHPELKADLRHEWLVNHPKENSLLALFGEAKLAGMEAYNEFKKLVSELDIPDNAIPELTLPPDASVKNYFTREEAVAEYGAQSAEAQLILAQDDALREWYGFQKPDYPARYYELKVKNREEREYWEKLGDKDDTEYVEDLKERRRIFLEKYPGSRYFADEARCEAIANGFSDEQVELWAKRKEIIDESGDSSPEARLFLMDNLELYRKALEEKLLKDKGGLPTTEERGMYTRWSYEALKIRVENTAEEIYWRELSDKDSESYIYDIKERWAAFDKKFPDSDYRLDLERIEAFENGFTKEEAELWAQRGEEVIEHGPTSSEVKVWLLDHPDIMQKAIALGMIEPDYKSWNEPLLRLNVKWRKEDREYDALPVDDDSRERYLAEHADYRMDRRRRDAYAMTGPNGEAFPVGQVENYVAYYELPEKGKRRDRYLINNPEFARAMHEIAGIDLPTKVPSVQYDDIYDQYKADFERLEGLGDNKSPYYIKDPEEREKAREAMRFKNGRITEFGIAEVRRRAYGEYIPGLFVERYVEYYKLLAEGPQESWPKDRNGNRLPWYEDDWYLIEHPAFYKEIYIGMLELEERDFDKIPSREVFQKYAHYVNIVTTTERNEYRLENPDLEEWLLLTEKVTTPITEKKRRQGLTSKEKKEKDLAKLREKIKR